MANPDMNDFDQEEVAGTVYDLIRDIRDPEKPESLEELDVVYEEGVKVQLLQSDLLHITVTFSPTVPHCSLATLIGLCIRMRLERGLPQKHKLDIYIKEGTHNTRDEINKQINDKERIAAAMENPNLKGLVDECLEAQDY